MKQGKLLMGIVAYLIVVALLLTPVIQNYRGTNATPNNEVTEMDSDFSSDKDEPVEELAELTPDFSKGFKGFVRISSSEGVGSGFVVAFDPETREGEAWTNAHVGGPVGTRSKVETWGGDYKEPVEGETFYSILKGVADAAKIRFTLPEGYPDPYVFTVGDSDVDADLYLINFGAPRGLDPQSHVFNVRKNSRDGIVEMRQPTIGGQSGSCLVDQDGVVRAVVTWNYKIHDRFGRVVNNWGGASKLEWFNLGDGSEVRQRTSTIPALPAGFERLAPSTKASQPTTLVPFGTQTNQIQPAYLPPATIVYPQMINACPSDS